MTGIGLPRGYRRMVREHVFDKCWSLDVTWAEIDALVESSTVVERHEGVGRSVKEIRLLRGWVRPLHIVCAIDHDKRIIIFITVYEPDLTHWRQGFKERRH